MANLLLTGTYVQCASALEQINSNCGLPNEQGTKTWSDIYVTSLADFSFLIAPPIDGWNDFTYAEMMTDVINVEIQEFDSAWNPTTPWYSN